jgi:2-polyprenyl-3-methyl-5-hydroxy-6-metoxy-1,4-benzoquinol methylase
MNTQHNDVIRSRECPNCYVCGSLGRLLYTDLEDRLFSAPGKWEISQCTNAECGTLWLNPMPIEEDIIRAYQDYYTHSSPNTRQTSLKQKIKHYLKMGYTTARYGYDIPSVNRLQKLVSLVALFFVAGHLQFDYNLMYLSASLRGKLLEIGFGGADALRNMASLGWEAYGVDFDPVAVENALKAGLEVRQGSLEEQGYSDEFFDAITMSHLIEHVHEPSEILKECFRILKPGGMLVAITPNVSSLGHTIFKNTWFNLDPPRHLHLFTPQALKRLAIEAGFKTVEVKTSRRDLYNTYLRSMTIRTAGRADMYSNPNPLVERLFALAGKLFELFQAKVTTQYGGEMILFAKK